MERKVISYKDDVLINLDGLTFSKKPIPLYAASVEGIYRVVNSEEIWKKVQEDKAHSRYVIKLLYIPTTLITLIAIIALLFVHSKILLYYLLIFILTIVASFYTFYIVKDSTSSNALKSNELIGELVVPWNEISSIKGLHLRSVGPSIAVDWEIHTRSGEVITIPNVRDPNVICYKIRKKFWPCSI